MSFADRHERTNRAGAVAIAASGILFFLTGLGLAYVEWSSGDADRGTVIYCSLLLVLGVTFIGYGRRLQQQWPGDVPDASDLGNEQPESSPED